jgi:hypothetical protein
METWLGVRWQSISTELDQMFFPHIEVGPGEPEGRVATLLLKGNRLVENNLHTRSEEMVGWYLISFRDPVVINAYSETLYWSLCEEIYRPNSTISVIKNSRLLARTLKRLPYLSGCNHYVVCGGDACVEVICSGFEISQHADFETATQAALALRSEWELRLRAVDTAG